MSLTDLFEAPNLEDLEEQIAKQEKQPDWQEKIPWTEWISDQFHPFRMVGGVARVGIHWIASLRRDGTRGKSFPIWCRKWNPKTGKDDLGQCPKCHGYGVADTICTAPGCGATYIKCLCPCCDDLNIRVSFYYCANVISREMQQEGHENPVYAMQLPETSFKKLLSLKQLNGGNHINNPDIGCDFWIRYIKKENSEYYDYDTNKGDLSPLTPEERNFKYIDIAAVFAPAGEEWIREQLKRVQYYGTDKPAVQPADGPAATAGATTPAQAPAQGPAAVQAPAQGPAAVQAPAQGPAAAAQVQAPAPASPQAPAQGPAVAQTVQSPAPVTPNNPAFVTLDDKAPAAPPAPPAEGPAAQVAGARPPFRPHRGRRPTTKEANAPQTAAPQVAAPQATAAPAQAAAPAPVPVPVTPPAAAPNEQGFVAEPCYGNWTGEMKCLSCPQRSGCVKEFNAKNNATP